MLAVALSPFFAVRRWVRYRRNMQALDKLDDRMLRDIGLTRTALENVVWRQRALTFVRLLRRQLVDDVLRLPHQIGKALLARRALGKAAAERGSILIAAPASADSSARLLRSPCPTCSLQGGNGPIFAPAFTRTT